MNTRSILEGISFMNLILLILAVSYALFGNQMQTIILDEINSKVEIGFFFNCSLIFSEIYNFNYTIARNNCLYLDLKELNIESYKGKFFELYEILYLKKTYIILN